MSPFRGRSLVSCLLVVSRWLCVKSNRLVSGNIGRVVLRDRVVARTTASVIVVAVSWAEVVVALCWTGQCRVYSRVLSDRLCSMTTSATLGFDATYSVRVDRFPALGGVGVVSRCVGTSLVVWVVVLSSMTLVTVCVLLLAYRGLRMISIGWGLVVVVGSGSVCRVRGVGWPLSVRCALCS